MASDALTRTRLVGGLWEGILSWRGSVPPKLALRHRDALIAEAETVQAAENSGNWLVRFVIPHAVISDGVQTLVIENAETGEALAHETIVAGEQHDEHLRAEVNLLRAELDMLKRAFRRHCAEHPI